MPPNSTIPSTRRRENSTVIAMMMRHASIASRESAIDSPANSTISAKSAPTIVCTLRELSTATIASAIGVSIAFAKWFASIVRLSMLIMRRPASPPIVCTTGESCSRYIP